MRAPLPTRHEPARLRALARYQVLDTEAEAAFDDLTWLASQLCAAPIALMSLVDRDRQWFKSHIGMETRETPRDISFCAHAIHRVGVFEVPDTLQDPCFQDNPLVVGPPHLRFYAGAVLTTADGHNLGTICVADRVPRRLTVEQQSGLRRLAAQAVDQLELRRARRQAERMAVEARDLYDHTPCGQMLLGGEGAILSINQTALRWLGVSRRQVVRRMTIDAVFVSDEGDLLDRLERHGRVDGLAGRLQPPCGEAIPVMVHGTSAASAEGGEARYRVSLVDVRAQREVESELARFFEVSRDLFCVGTVDGGLLRVNPAFSQTLGWTSEELLACPSLDLVHPDDRELTRSALRGLGEGAARVDIENRYRCRDQTWRWLRWTVALGPDGRRVYASGRDVTELREVQQRLAESEERHRTVLRSIGEAVIVTDRDERITFMNDVAEQLTGWSEADALGRALSAVFVTASEGTGAGLVPPLDSALLSDSVQPLPSDTVLVRRDGTRRPIGACAAPVRAGGEEVTGGVIAFHDDRAERAMKRILREERYRLRSVIEGTQLATWQWNLQTGRVDIDERWARIVGRTLDDSPAPSIEAWMDLVHPDDLDDVRRALQRNLQGQVENHHLEYRLGHRQGHWVWVLDRGKILERSADGRPRRMFGTLQEIGARKHTEEALRATVDRFDALVSATAAVIFTQRFGDVDAPMSYMSPSVREVLGYEPAQCSLPSFWRQIAHLDDVRRIEKAAQAVIERGSHVFECRFRHADGGWRWMLTAIRVRRDGRGQPVEVVTSMMDVTDEHRARRELLQFRTAVDRTVDAVLMARSDTLEIIYANDGALRQLGYLREQLVGRPLSDVAPAASVTPEEVPPSPFQSAYRRRDGSEMPVELTLQAVQTSDGPPILVSIARDIRDRLAMQRRDEEMRQELERQVESRTRSLRSALKEKEVLLQEIHHRVKNNLQIISSLLNLQADGADERLAAALHESIQRVRSMALIHERLYRSDTLARIDFGEYARSLATALCRSYQRGGPVQLVAEVEPVEVNIETAVPLGLILNELISNALKHALGSNGGRLFIGVRREGEQVVLEVSDSGAGFPDGFDPAAASSMGMALITSLARQLKAELDISNSPGACTRLRLKELTYAER